MSDDLRHSIDVSLEAARADAAPEREPGGPFRILVVGDFRGRAWRAADDRTARDPAPVRVDRDTYDEVLARLAPRIDVTVPPNEAPTTLVFRELDDFHPDRLYERQAYFRQLCEEWRRQGVSPDVPAGPVRAPAPDRPVRMSSELLEAMLAEGDGADAITDAPQQYDLEKYMQRSLREARTQEPTLQERTRQRVFATLVEGRLRAVLHHPAYRAAESHWRAVDMLVRRVPDDVAVHVYLLDATREELAAMLAGEGIALVPGGARTAWSLQVVLHDVADTPDDVALLGAMAAVAERTRAPWVVGGTRGAFGAADAEDAEESSEWRPASEAWNTLRARAGAGFVAVVAPRFVLRMPYGRRDEPCEVVELEEMKDAASDAYLWGSGALVAALSLAHGVDEGGPSPRRPFVLDGLPLPLRRTEGSEPEAVPVTEVSLSDRAGAVAAERGVTPLLAARGADRLLLPALRSLAAGGAPLAGSWNLNT